jgi:zinc transporter, ZIP family
VDGLAWQVLWVSVITALATGLGALPFVFVRNLSRRWEGIAAAIAGGMMISASVFALANKALEMGEGSLWQTTAGMLGGALFFAWTARRVGDQQWTVHTLSASDSRRAVLVLATMFVHSVPEGVAIGVGYATGETSFGLLLGLAIAAHNVPEGMAVSLPLRAKGVPVWKCAAYAVFTSLPQPLLAVPSYLLVAVVQPLLPAGLGFAGGAMLFLVVAELIPESLERCSREDTAWGGIVGLLAMLWMMVGLGM